MVVAWIACLTYGWLEAKRDGKDTTYVADLSLVIFVGGILGARVLFVIIEYKHFLTDPLGALKIWQGGLVYYGGLGGAALASIAYLSWRREPLGWWADFLAPVPMLMLVFGRIGCFLNGCCYGKTAAWLPDFCIYPISHPAPEIGLAQLPAHPVQLYESFLCLLIFLYLLRLHRRRRFTGETFWTMALLYAIIRFGLEFLRADPRGSVPALGLSTSQVISAVMAAVAVSLLVRLRRSGTRPEAPK